MIQQYGSHLNIDGTTELNNSICLAKIEDALSAVKVHTADLQEKMRAFFSSPK